jgi:hypothetical protein
MYSSLREDDRLFSYPAYVARDALHVIHRLICGPGRSRRGNGGFSNPRLILMKSSSKSKCVTLPMP